MNYPPDHHHQQIPFPGKATTALLMFFLFPKVVASFSIQPTIATIATRMGGRHTTTRRQNDDTRLPVIYGKSLSDSGDSISDEDPVDDPVDFFTSQMASNNNSIIADDPPLLMEESSKMPSMITRLRQWAGEYDAQVVQAQLQGWIDDYPVLMLSFATCPYCQQVQSILNAKTDIGIVKNYHCIDLDVLSMEDYRYATRVELYNLTGRTGAPAVWINGEYIGGCNDGGMGGVATLDESGRLDELLQQVQYE